jgi:hypothetical protein
MFAKTEKVYLIKDGGKTVELTKKKPKQIGRFRRRSQPQPTEQEPPLVPDERSVAMADRSQEEAREAATSSVEDERSIFGGKDKRQKKIVYQTFGEKPGQVLEAAVEEIPEPAFDTHVIIKVSVSSLDCFFH